MENIASPYQALSPERIMNAVESMGFVCTGQLMALNSYENRVYQVGVDEAVVIAKFYRPARWSDEAIREELAFVNTLADREIPAVPAVVDKTGQALQFYDDFRFAVFPSRGGRWPDLDNKDHLQWLGRLLGRIHALGSTQPFQHRSHLSIESYGETASQFLLENKFIPDYLIDAYESVVRDALAQVRMAFDRAAPLTSLRIYGDCHPGNILWTEKGPHFVDFDDCCMGPAIQDLWMLISGSNEEMSDQLSQLVKGYQLFHEFPWNELHLIEALRTLRLMHYSAWLARRWNDPAFPLNFPWFNETRYWEEHIQSLREQIGLMQGQPVLSLDLSD